jgi:hypothetical protein
VLPCWYSERGIRAPPEEAVQSKYAANENVLRFLFRVTFRRVPCPTLRMSAVCILAPVVISAWPAFSSAVVAAAASMGYVVAEEAVNQLVGCSGRQLNRDAVNLEIPNSEIVTSQLGRDQRISVSRDGVTITFSRDARGKAGVCVLGNGSGQSEEELRAAGEELSHRVVQQYVYQRLTDEVAARGYVVVDESRDANQAIHMRIRHWEN